MNKPRFVLDLSKIVEIIKSRTMIIRFIPAIIEPIIVSQFLEEGGSFMIARINWFV